MDTASHELLPPQQLLKKTWEFYKKRIKTFIGIMLVPTLVTYLMREFLPIKQFLPSSFSNGSPADFMSQLPLFIGLILLYSLITIIVYLWQQAALLTVITSSSDQVGVYQAFQKGWNKIGQMGLIIFLFGFISMAGFLLFIIPGIVFWVWYGFAGFVYFTENIKGMNALLKSREYVRGLAFSVFRRLLFINLFLFIFIFIPLSVIFLGIKQMPLPVITLPPFLNVLGNQIADVGFTILWTPFVLVYTYLIFQNVKSVRGEFTFSPTRRAKIIILLISLLGFLVFPLLGIGAISAINPVSQLQQARDEQRKSDEQHIQSALALYYRDTNTYPESLSSLVPNYLANVPADPQTQKSYRYSAQPEGQDYQLCLNFEKKSQTCVSSKSP